MLTRGLERARDGATCLHSGALGLAPLRPDVDDNTPGMKTLPPMKFWEAVSAFRESPHVLAEVFASDKWRATFGERFSRFDELVRTQDRSALDLPLPLDLTRDLAKRCQGLTFSYSPETRSLRRMTLGLAEDPQAIILSALDVHDRFGGSAIEEVLEYGSTIVADDMGVSRAWSQREAAVGLRPDS